MRWDHFRGAHSLKSGTERSGNSTKSHAPATRVQSLAEPEKHMAQVQHNMWVTNLKSRALDHHWRWKMGGDHGPNRPALSERPGLRGKEILALCPLRRDAAPDQCRRAAPSD
jgi:hypothetical protein